MGRNYRQTLIAFVTFLGGLYFFLEYMLPETIGTFKFGRYHDQISTGVALVGTMAIGLGLWNIFRIHGMAVARLKKGWPSSFALLAGFFVMLIAGSLDFIGSVQSVTSWKQIEDLKKFSEHIFKDQEKKTLPAAPRLERMLGVLERAAIEASSEASYLSLLSVDETHRLAAAEFNKQIAQAKNSAVALVDAYKRNVSQEEIKSKHGKLEEALGAASDAAQEIATANYESRLAQRISHLLFEGFFNSLSTSMFALLAFYIANAAYRSFRIRSMEALIMMLTALVVILGQIPQGYIYVHPALPAIRLWLIRNLSTPAFRAIFFGSAIAGLSMAVRMWLSLEKSPLSGEDA